MKNKLCGIGEALIDFIPEVKGQRLKDVPSFKKSCGRSTCQCSRGSYEAWYSIQIFNKA